MKKLLLLILSAVLILMSFCACDQGPADSSSGNQEINLVLSKTEKNLFIGEEYELVVYSESHRTQKITWTSSNPSVATVENGKIAAQTLGATVITATAEDGKVATCDINVITGGMLPVLTFEFDYDENISVDLNEKLNFYGWVVFNEMEFFDMQISYEVSNEAVGTVDSEGTFSPLAKGVTVVTVTAQWRNVPSELLTRTFTVTVI